MMIGRSWKRALPVAFLGLSLAVAGFGALEAYRAERSHRAAATGVLTDYGDFAAWSFEQRVAELLAVRFNNTFSVARTNQVFARGQATRQCLALLREPTGPADCECASTRLAGEWSFFVRLGDDPPAAEWGGIPPTYRASVIDATRNHARERYESGWGFALMRVEGGPLVAYARLTTATTLDEGMVARTDTLLYGVEVDREELAALYRWTLENGGLLPRSLTAGHPSAEVLRIEVVDDFGQTLFASREEGEPLYPATVPIRPGLGGGMVRASVLPDVADELVIGGLPGDRTPVLALIVALATALAGAALVQIRRENRLSHLRQDFVASVSHELRTPLAQVRLFTETLRLGRTRNATEREWALASIDRETVRLTHLVENILHFSRAERGVRSTEREWFDVGAEARETVDAFRPLVPPSRGGVEVEVEPGLEVRAHRDSFRQVLLNYLDNAVRYGAEGQMVRVEVARRAGRVRLTVDDDGPGVPPSERERIFEPFRRGTDDGHTSVAGSGIGLSVVREIAEAHEGHAWVEDAPGGGARFAFELPLAKTARPGHFASSEPLPSETPEAEAGAGAA